MILKNFDYRFESCCSLKDVKKCIEKILAEKRTGEVWVVFDIDETLTIKKLKDKGKEYFLPGYVELNDGIDTMHISDEEKYDFSRWASYELQNLLDPETKHILEDLSNKNLKLFSCTAAGSRNRFRKVERLNRISLDFSDAFEFTEKILDDLPMRENTYPTYYRGFLFANGPRQKGIALKSFIEKVECKPSCIIVVDDQQGNLDDIYEVLRETPVKYFPILLSYPMPKEKVPSNVLMRFLEESYGRFKKSWSMEKNR